MENLQGSWFPLGSHFGKHHFCNRMSDGTDRKAPMWDVFWTRITSWPPYELCHMMLHVFTMFPLHFCLYLSTWACLFSWKWLITRFVSQSESLYCIAPKRNNKNLNYKKMDYQNNTEDTQSPFKKWNRREEAITNNFACLTTEILCFCVFKTKSPLAVLHSTLEKEQEVMSDTARAIGGDTDTVAMDMMLFLRRPRWNPNLPGAF